MIETPFASRLLERAAQTGTAVSDVQALQLERTTIAPR